MTFGTTPAGSVADVERMRITSVGRVGINFVPGANGASLDVATSPQGDGGIIRANVGGPGTPAFLARSLNQDPTLANKQCVAVQGQARTVAGVEMPNIGQFKWLPEDVDWQSSTIALDLINNGAAMRGLTVKSTTKVGIGVADPLAQLHVYAPDSTMLLGLQGTSKGIRFQTNSNGAMIEAVDNSLTASFQPLLISSSSLLMSSNSASVNLPAGGLIYLRGPNSGVFGPNVYNMVMTGEDAYNSGFAGSGISFAGKTSSAGAISDLAFISGVKENTADGDYAGALLFGTRPNGSGGGSFVRMRIQSDGKVLIGATGGQTLSVGGVIYSQTNGRSGFRCYNGGAVAEWFAGQWNTTDHDYLIQETTGENYTTRLRLGIGNVGLTINDRLLLQHDTANGFVRNSAPGPANLYLGTDNANMVALNKTAMTMHPVASNAYALGFPSILWTAVYAANGTIQTSDEREKTWLGAPDEAAIRAAGRIIDELGFFTWNEGDTAIHFGVRAQQVLRILIDEGLEDPFDFDIARDVFVTDAPVLRHAIVRFDTWEAAPDMSHAPYPEGEDPPMNPPGNRFSMNLAELSLFVATAQHARLNSLEARLAAAGL